MEETDRSRRRFLGSLAAGAASLLLLGRWLSPRTRPAAATELLSVPAADVPADGALVFREARVAVVRAGGEPYALRLVCTHLGCTLSVGPRDIECPCHGSRFDLSGNVLRGPAARPLDRLRVERRGDRLAVLS